MCLLTKLFTKDANIVQPSLYLCLFRDLWWLCCFEVGVTYFII